MVTGRGSPLAATLLGLLNARTALRPSGPRMSSIIPSSTETTAAGNVIFGGVIAGRNCEGPSSCPESNDICTCGADQAPKNPQRTAPSRITATPGETGHFLPSRENIDIAIGMVRCAAGELRPRRVGT